MPKYVLFDTETTGNQEQDRIIQVGALIVHSKENIEVYDELCFVDVPISLEAMEVHNITPDIIENQPAYSELEFTKKLEAYNEKENYLIAHNINFDLGMVEKEGFENNYTLIDTLRCAKHLLPDSPYHRLQYLRYALELYKTEGAEAHKLGVSVGTIQLGAHVNNAFNGRSDNPLIKTGVFDTAEDQNAIRIGYFYPNRSPLPVSLLFDTTKNPGAWAPWNKDDW